MGLAAIDRWRSELVNDFEAPIMTLKPSIEALRTRFYEHGAGYAAMTGSGAAVFGTKADNQSEDAVKTQCGGGGYHRFGTLLFDLQADPGQEHSLDDPELEADLIRRMVKLMQANECPPEQYERLGIEAYV